MAPAMDELKKCYDILRKTHCISKAAMLCSKSEMNYCKFRIALDVFEEMGLIKVDLTCNKAEIIPNAPKADLSKSQILAKLK